jgi:CHRD domain
MAGSSHIPLESNPNPKRRNTLEMLRRLVRTAIMVSAFTSLSIAATGATVALKADLKASSEVPPKESAGKGTLTATLDTGTNELKYHVEFSGLTGPVVAAHFHGPAAEGVNAKPQVPIKTSPITSPLDGTATITTEQAKDLLDGKWYFNLHTAANPGGEIRGQVLKAN